MKVGYITGQYPRVTDTFIQREILSLRKQGLEIHTFSVRKTNAEQLTDEEQKNEFHQTYYLLAAHFTQFAKSHLYLILTKTFQYFKTIKLACTTSQPGIRGFIFQLFYFAESGVLAQELQHRQIRHIHNHIADSSCTVAMLAAELCGARFSFTIHGPYIFFEPYRWSLEEKIKRASFVVCISNFCRSQCMLFSPFEQWSKLHIVHCGVEPHLFPARIHKGLGKKLLYIGRLAAAKGLPVVFECLVTLRQCLPCSLELTIVGDGPDRGKLEKQVSELKLDSIVRFVGYQSQANIRRYLQATDIFVLPSFAEGVPVSLMEAMASGIPVISTQVGGICELLKDGESGYLVAPGDTTQLAHRIKKLYSSPELRQAFGESGRRYVQQEFNIEKETQELLKLIMRNCQS